MTRSIGSRGWFRALFLGLALGFAATPFAHAQSRCDLYADSAVAAFAANRSEACGLAGPRWNPDREGHRIWCLTVSDDVLAAESAARERQLAQCRRGADTVDCLADAERDEARFAEASALGCTLSRPAAIGRGRADRVAWCQSSPAREVIREAEAREDELQQCRQAAVGLSCPTYAQRAVLQFDEATRLGCGFEGPAWSANTFGHREWCESVRPAIVEGEIARRDAALAECRFDARARSCPEFAATAVRAHALARANACDLAGPDWSDDAEGHRITCEALAPSAATALTARRRSVLRQCLDQVSFCEDHARHGVRQALEAAGRSCAVFLANQPTDFEAQRAWCRSVPRAVAEAAERQRTERLALCR